MDYVKCIKCGQAVERGDVCLRATCCAPVPRNVRAWIRAFGLEARRINKRPSVLLDAIRDHLHYIVEAGGCS